VADTEYLIDIAARMSAGDATISQLAQLEQKLSSSGASVATLEAALAQANGALAKTGDAATQANAELTASQAKYSQLEKAADSTAKALEKAGAATKGAVPIDLQQKASAAAAALQAEAAALDKARSAADAAGAAHKKAAAATEALTSATKDAAKAEAAAGAETSSLSSKIGELQIGAAVAGIAAVTSGIVALGAAAIGAHDENALMQAKLDALAGSTSGGAAAKAVIDDLATSVGITDDQLQPLAQQLLALGTPVDQLGGKLKALAAQQALGMGGDQAVLNVITRLQEGIKLSDKNLQELTKTAGITSQALANKLGRSIEIFRAKMKAGTLDSKEMADAIISVAGDKGMPALAVQAQSLKQKVANVKDAIGDMVAESINTSDAVGAIDAFGAVFDKNTESGKLMRAEIGGAFKEFSAAAVMAAPIAVAAIAKIAEAAKVLAKALGQATSAFDSVINTGDKPIENAPQVSGAGGKSQAAQLQELQAQLAAAKQESEFKWFTSYSDAEIASKENAANQVEVLTGDINQLQKDMGKGSSGAGQDVASGYAAGIRAGTPDAVAAGQEMSAQTQAALKSSDDSHSPSKKYEALGTYVPMGYGGGITKGAHYAKSALAGLGGPIGGGAGSPIAARAGISLTGPFHFYGVENAEDAEARFNALLTKAVEGDVQQLGGGHS